MRPEEIRRAAAAEAPKHGRLIRSARGGARLSAVMLPFLRVWAPPGYCVLTYRGRKTGRVRRKCLRAVRDQRRVYLLMLRPPALAAQRPDVVAAWVHNVRANPRVSVRLGLRTLTGVVRDVTEPAERAAAEAALCGRVHLMDYGECDLHMRGLPTRAKIEAMHRYWFDTGIPLVIDLD